MNPINETRHPTTPSLELPREVGVSDIAIVLAVFIGFLLLLGILFGVVLGVSNLALAATEAVSFAMAANAFRGRAKTTLMRYLDLRKTTAMAYIAGLCLSLGCVVPIAELNSLVVRAIPAPPAMREVLTMVAQSGGLFGAIAFAVVVAPLAEEMLFRGIVQKSLSIKYGNFVAIVASSLLFSIIHINPWQFVSTLILGVVLGLLYMQSKSLRPAVLTDALNNALILIVSRTHLIQAAKSIYGTGSLTPMLGILAAGASAMFLILGSFALKSSGDKLRALVHETR